MRWAIWLVLATLCSASLTLGCAFRVTAIPLSEAARNDSTEEAIPYYLPKPYLVVTKNVATTMAEFPPAPQTPVTPSQPGSPQYPQLPGSGGSGGGGKDTNGDGDKKNGDTDSGVATQGADDGSGGDKPKDPAKPEPPAKPTPTPAPKKDEPPKPANDGGQAAGNQTITGGIFFTYRIVYLPDVKQKYGLKISGNAGNIATILRLIHGWQFQGLETLSIGNSSTADMILAGGHATTQVAMALAGAAGVPLPGAAIQGAGPDGPEPKTNVTLNRVPESVVAGIYMFELDMTTSQINPTPVIAVEFNGTAFSAGGTPPKDAEFNKLFNTVVSRIVDKFNGTVTAEHDEPNRRILLKVDASKEAEVRHSLEKGESGNDWFEATRARAANMKPTPVLILLNGTALN